ncbi:S10 family peptidase [Gracilimonas aurantiaca]|uniref:S10 family peptidase n=1 Tax=Gracilimonas aurantiaca TaxID=3234185 RepID=UPI00390C8E8D
MTEIPAEEKNVTSHSIRVDGETIQYDATAATKLIYDVEGNAIASWGYIAYTRTNGADKSDRPVTFVFNGGPGSSSIWLHMGAVGPKRVVLDDPEFNDSGYTLVDNEYSILDETDIVMVDPVGTGITRAVGKKKNSDFWGVEADISSISNFINSYINEYDRWASPKFLLGESYGTFRSAGLAPYLQNTYGIALDGIVLVSNVLDLRTITFGPEDDTSFILFLPAYAATAWYHEKVPNRPSELELFVDEARSFAYGAYSSALMKGDELGTAERNQVLDRLVRFTGLKREYLDRSNLRVTASAFFKELLAEEEMYVGRLDSRYKGYSMDPLAKDAIYDPQSAAISPPYQMAFMDYYHTELGFGKDKQYNFSAYSLPGFNWNWTRNAQGTYFPSSPTTVQDLRQAMILNPKMKVMVQNGYYDLATPFSGTEYTFDHMNLPDDLKDNIELTYYEAGHMFYINMPDMEKFRNDTIRFITED